MTLVELGTYLVSQGVGTALGTDVFLGRVPALPDVVVCLFEYASLPVEPRLGVDGTQIRYEYPRVQILCRGAKDDYQGPWNVAKSARTAMMKIQASTLSGTYYIAAMPESGPMFLRRDLNDRIEIVTNYQIMKAES